MQKKEGEGGEMAETAKSRKDVKEVTKKKLWSEKKLYWFKKQFR